VGLGLSASPGPDLLEAVAAGAITLLLMHLTGALHSPAIAVSLIAVLTEFSAPAAVAALPLLVGLSMLVVLLAWGAHRMLGDADYPARWW
ncbi:MAG TPA: HPP family protein, partial [Actinomycetes bacterium]|nr:HPP family protein [Actinomycetes bacterium]